MAFRDSSGAITIDEWAAQADINKEAQAVGILREVAQVLIAVEAEAGSYYQGETAAAIAEKAQALGLRVQNLIGALEETQDYTRRVVEYYRELDRRVREAIQAGKGG